MSRPPRRRRPSRIIRWEGLVEDVDKGKFFARLIRLDKGTPDRWAPELWTVFDLRHLPQAEAGMLFNLYVHKRGKKVRTVLHPRDLGTWTAEEVAAVKASAARLAAAISEVTDL